MNEQRPSKEKLPDWLRRWYALKGELRFREAADEIERLSQDLARTESARVAIMGENTHYKRRVAELELIIKGKTFVTDEPEPVPTAWMCGHRNYSPGEPDDYDVECVYGDDPPDDSGNWIPLYRRPAFPAGQFICPHGKDVRHIECAQCSPPPPGALLDDETIVWKCGCGWINLDRESPFCAGCDKRRNTLTKESSRIGAGIPPDGAPSMPANETSGEQS